MRHLGLAYSPAVPEDAVFRRDGPVYVPGELARGPWSPGHQHGGAPAALLARAVERVNAPLDTVMHVARLTVDLVRPVPLAPLSLETRVSRPGYKVQVVDAVLRADGTDVAWCRALRLRTTMLELEAPADGAAGLPAPEASEPLELFAGEAPGFWNALDLRVARGSWLEPGPAAVWFRLRVPIVEGERPSALQRVAAAADFGNGVSSALWRDHFTFVNPDLDVFLHRLPAGEWVGLDARSFVEPTGIGLADTALVDERGRIGRAVQTLLLERR